MSKSSTKTRVTAEYVWVYNNELYSKSRTLEIRSLDELEVKNLSKWDVKVNSESLVITPINVYNCPFRGQNGILVFCKTDDTRISEKSSSGSYSVLQQYYIINPNLMRPYGFPSLVNPNESLRYSCGVGLQKCYGRKFADLHYKLCLSTGIKMTELNSSNSPSKWEYVVEGNSRNDICSHLWMSRYILHRVGENCNVIMKTCSSELNEEVWNKTLCYINKNGEETEHNGNVDIIIFI